MPIRPEGERIAALETAVQDMRGDIAEYSREQQRTRSRLHHLESTVAALVQASEAKREDDRRHERRLSFRLSLLMAAVAVVGLVEPIAFAVVRH